VTFELRDYQRAAIERVHDRLGEGHRPIVCAATGSGKTVIAAHLAREYVEQGKRVLWQTGREEIIRQAYKTFVDIIGVNQVGVLCAGLKGELPWWSYPAVALASWDTLKARWNKSRVWQVPADLVMVDEAHLSLSPVMSRTIMPHYADKHVVGFTATPSRQSGLGLGHYYSRIIQVRRVKDLQADGWLAPIEYWGGSSVDTANVPVDAKTRDYRAADLAAASMHGQLIGDVIDNWLRIARDRRSIVFACGIPHAQALAERFRGAGIEAEAIHSQQEHETRSRISEQFRNGAFPVLVNVGIATYGYDVPEVRCVVLARATKSIVLYHQMIGRGIRSKPDGDHCIVIDHGDNVRRLGYVEDDIRWRLDERQEAATNTTRAGDRERNKKAEAAPTLCGNCGRLFAMSRVCPACGWEKPARAVDVDAVDADLVRLHNARSDAEPAQQERRTWFQMVRGWARQTNRKPGLAYFRYREKFGEEPPREWSRLPDETPDARVTAEMHKAMRNFARRASYARRASSESKP
jgi:DNA repair protein RadD